MIKYFGRIIWNNYTEILFHLSSPRPSLSPSPLSLSLTHTHIRKHLVSLFTLHQFFLIPIELRRDKRIVGYFGAHLRCGLLIHSSHTHRTHRLRFVFRVRGHEVSSIFVQSCHRSVSHDECSSVFHCTNCICFLSSAIQRCHQWNVCWAGG